MLISLKLIYGNVSGVIKGIKSTNKNIDTEFSVIFKQAERVAAKVVTAKVVTSNSLPCSA